MTSPDRVLYQGFISDNTRWDALPLRPDDIVISTPSKCGTTWTQRLISLLVFDGPDLPGPLSLVSPWLDMTIRPIGEVVAGHEAQTHRRFVKTHTPLDGLVLDDRVTYIIVGRDPRDAAVSMLHHDANMDRDRLTALRVAASGAPPETTVEGQGPDDPEARRRWWIDSPPTLDGRESLATVVRLLATAWERRHQPNVHLLHYADYTTDLPGELVRLGAALGYDISRERAEELAVHATIDAMRDRADDVAPNATDGVWLNTAGFFRVGGRGGWRDVFSPDDQVRYAARLAVLAPPDLVAWLHDGWGDGLRP